MAPEHNIRVDGCLKPRSKFLGNSAASMMEGIAVLRFLNTGERLYVEINWPLAVETDKSQLYHTAKHLRARNLVRHDEVRAW
jgi:hypothetical protein